jgi:fructose-1-phosphate kinase PfkB-like protein
VEERADRLDLALTVLCGTLPAGLPPEIYGSLTSYAARAGVLVILNAGSTELQEAVKRGPTMVIPDEIAPRESMAPADKIAKALMAAGPAAVAVPTGHGALAVTGEGEWQAMASAAPHEAAAPVPPELAAADRRVALAESVTPAGEADLRAYEKLPPTVRVTSPPRPARSRSS